MTSSLFNALYFGLVVYSLVILKKKIRLDFSFVTWSKASNGGGEKTKLKQQT